MSQLRIVVPNYNHSRPTDIHNNNNVRQVFVVDNKQQFAPCVDFKSITMSDEEQSLQQRIEEYANLLQQRYREFFTQSIEILDRRVSTSSSESTPVVADERQQEQHINDNDIKESVRICDVCSHRQIEDRDTFKQCAYCCREFCCSCCHSLTPCVVCGKYICHECMAVKIVMMYYVDDDCNVVEYRKLAYVCNVDPCVNTPASKYAISPSLAMEDVD